MTTQGPFSFPAVDTIRIGADVMPGQWILQPTYLEYGWQVQQGWGQSGATVFPIGDQLVNAPFLVKFWSARDWASFQPFRMKYIRKAVVKLGGTATYALGIVHPELAALGVTSVVVKKNPAFTNNGKGLWTGAVEFLQYRKAQPALERPAASIPAAAAPQPSAADAIEQAQLSHQAQVMGSRG